MAAQFATESMDNPLWDFSLALYNQPGVKDCLLRLQNEAGMDVLMLLADRWLIQQGKAWVSDAELHDYLIWRREIVEPLRALRMRLERNAEPLRTQLLQAELSAEREGLNRLYRVLSAATDISSRTLLDINAVFFDGQKKEALEPLFSSFIKLAQA